MDDLQIDHRLIQEILERDPRYHQRAYLFVLSALHYVISSLPQPRQVSARELCAGGRDLAIELFGPLARTVLESWGIHSTRDIGEIVFNLLESEVLTKTEEESLEDFIGVYDFKEVFEKQYPWGKLNRGITRP